MQSSPISEHLHDLLLQYDCVIVPEMGGFVTEYRSARIDTQRHIIYPPSKDLRFNTQLKQNDGLLANAIARATSVSHESANTMIKSSVEQYFTQLEEGKTVEFDRVGILYLDSAKNIRFKANTEANLLLDSFRLKTIYAQPSAKDVKEIEPATAASSAPVLLEVKPKLKHPKPLIAAGPQNITRKEEVAIAATDSNKEQEKEVPVVPIHTSSNGRRWLAAALIPLLLYLGSVGMRSDVVRDGTIMASDLNPFGPKPPAAEYQPRNEITTVSFDSIDDVSTPTIGLKPKSTEVEDSIVAEKGQSSNTTLAIDETEELVAKPVSTYVEKAKLNAGSFHVIGGCFSEKDNANRLVETLQSKGYPAHILDVHKGLHRVAYSTYAMRSEALDALKFVKEEEHSGAWLLRKK
jgi:cell division septation protein DedD/nucleoid DNA-binding protein